MQACISTSNFFLTFVLLAFVGSSAQAVEFEQYHQIPDTVDEEASQEDFRDNGFTRYGEFDEEENEREATLFFQYGRFFGVSLGAGFQGVTGNRGQLWQGGAPLVDIRIHYWFDFNFALQLGFSTVDHVYENPVGSGAVTNVTLNRLGVDLKYYFDIRDIAAPIAFINPYLLVGGGSYQKTEEATQGESVALDAQFGLNAGLGFEFLISPKKSYFDIEAKVHQVNFEDRFNQNFATNGIPDLTGVFYTLTASVLFTW